MPSLVALIFSLTAQAPAVSDAADGWRISFPAEVIHFQRSPSSYIKPLIVTERRLIIIPTDESIEAWTFQGKKAWGIAAGSAYDPGFMETVGDTLVLYLGKSVFPTNPSPQRYKDVIAFLKDTQYSTGIDIATGRVKWKRSNYEVGVPLSKLGGTSFLTVRIANPVPYYRGSQTIRLLVDRRKGSSGELIQSWALPVDTNRLIFLFHNAPESSRPGLTAVEPYKGGWKLIAKDETSKPKQVVEILLVDGKGLVRFHPPSPQKS